MAPESGTGSLCKNRGKKVEQLIKEKIKWRQIGWTSLVLAREERRHQVKREEAETKALQLCQGTTGRTREHITPSRHGTHMMVKKKKKNRKKSTKEKRKKKEKEEEE